MQLPQLYRRGVVAPLTDEAEAELSTWSATLATQVDHLPIPSQGIFEDLWQAGIFCKLNDACGSLIDDYEEERLPPDQLPTALEVLTACRKAATDPALQQFLDALVVMCRSAIGRNHALYFIL